MRDISLWIEFLIYTSFALLAISYILFYSHLISVREKTKIDVNNIQNILTDIYVVISTYRNCGVCLTSIEEKLPDSAYLYLYNNSNEIYILYYSTYNYTPSTLYVNLNVTKLGSIYKYNFSKEVPTYLLSQKNLTITGNFCLTINISYGKVYLSTCK